MRVAALGRTRWLYDSVIALRKAGHEIALIGTSPAAPEYDIAELDFERLAKELGCPYFCDTSLNSPTRIQQLKAAGADAAISVNWLTLVDPEVLACFKHGIINAHAGDLPRFRGNACPNWAIIAGEPNIGLCIHKMTPELDAGPVYQRDYYPLGPGTYIGDVYGWLGARIPSMFEEVVQRLASGTLAPQDQPVDPQLQLRAYPRRPEDGRIDWRAPALEVHRLIRASSRPFSGAYTTLEGKLRVAVWRAERVSHAGQFLAVPGQVCYRIDGDPVVACGDGMLRLTDLTVEGYEEPGEGRRAIAGSLRNRLI